MTRLTKYFSDTAAELKRVSWPTQKQAAIYTALVVGLSVIVALLLNGFDVVFTRLIEFIV